MINSFVENRDIACEKRFMEDLPNMMGLAGAFQGGTLSGGLSSSYLRTYSPRDKMVSVSSNGDTRFSGPGSSGPDQASQDGSFSHRRPFLLWYHRISTCDNRHSGEALG